MIPLPSGTKIWLVAGITDMRNGFNGLAAKVQTALKDDPMSGHVFIFRGRSGSQVKLLWSTGDGLCLAADTSARTEKPAPRWFRLSNGRQVNLVDWKVVLFMQGRCPYCHQFDPVLKQLAQQYGFSVFPYTLDGQGDTAFPEALPVPPDVMQTFFPNIPVATPTTFLVNVNTLEATATARQR